MLLTKSLYMKGKDCPRAMVYKAKGVKTPPLSADSQLRIETGKRVGNLAQSLFPGGVLVESQGLEPEEAASKTQSILAECPPAVFEATFVDGCLSARIDVLRRLEDGWEAIEVKSSKSVKTDHKNDLAFQVFVARRAGLTVSRASVMVLNGDYVHGDEIDADDLLKIEDVTKDVEKRQADLPAETAEFMSVLDSGEMPESPMNRGCLKCDYFAECEPRLASDDIVYLYHPAKGQLDDLRARGIRTLHEIDPGWLGKVQQERQVRAHQGADTFIDHRAVADALGIEGNIHFVDFETVAPGIPVWSRTSPYLVVPFQWSNHILRNGEVTHEEFLHRERSDPREAFVDSLLRSVQDADHIVVYSDFESNRLKSLAELDIPMGKEVREHFEDKKVDLLKVIREHVYMREFMGSFSIKQVLPAMAPECNYKDLNIQEGGTASAKFLEMLYAPAETADRIAADLLAYCKQDTWAMVVLFRKLREMCGLA